MLTTTVIRTHSPLLLLAGNRPRLVLEALLEDLRLRLRVMEGIAEIRHHRTQAISNPTIVIRVIPIVAGVGIPIEDSEILSVVNIGVAS